MTSKELKSILTENKITLTTMQKKSICIHRYSIIIVMNSNNGIQHIEKSTNRENFPAEDFARIRLQSPAGKLSILHTEHSSGRQGDLSP